MEWYLRLVPRGKALASYHQRLGGFCFNFVLENEFLPLFFFFLLPLNGPHWLSLVMSPNVILLSASPSFKAIKREEREANKKREKEKENKKKKRKDREEARIS